MVLVSWYRSPPVYMWYLGIGATQRLSKTPPFRRTSLEVLYRRRNRASMGWTQAVLA
ncbi:MAG: hypothetical protein LBJ16_04190 [Holosporaceae bacterium]|nr:hypothetical protein [Holosporaceae bacterium]